MCPCVDLTCPVSYFPCCFTASNTPTVSKIFPSGLFLPKTGNTIKGWPQCWWSNVCKTSKTTSHMDSDKRIISVGGASTVSHNLKKKLQDCIFFSSQQRWFTFISTWAKNPVAGLRSLAFPFSCNLNHNFDKIEWNTSTCLMSTSRNTVWPNLSVFATTPTRSGCTLLQTTTAGHFE